MIWSLLKVLLFVVVIAALTWGAGVLLDTTGGVRVAFASMEYTLSPLAAVVALLILVLAFWIALKLVGLVLATLRFVSGDETAISRYFDRNRERKGYQALSDGMMALASGEGRIAMSRAKKADRYLDRPDLTTLLIAQAAEMDGDTDRATDAYKALLVEDRTRFVGVRGLMRQKITEGDKGTAMKLAQKAFELKPKHREVQDTLLELQADQGDWAGARQTLGAKLKAGSLPRDVFRRRDAVLALQEARDAPEGRDATEAAIEANRLSPDLIPAATMAARGLIARQDPRAAARILKKAWSASPHPDLAAAFAEIAPNETPAERVKRFSALTSVRPDDPETRMLAAELLIAAEDFPAARRALGDLATTRPTARSLAIMAAVERGEGADDAVVRGWLARALTAPRGPQWCCDKCHAIHSQWMPVCDNCGAFDTLTWRDASESAGPSATGTELLPLIVGTPEPSVTTTANGATDGEDYAEVLDDPVASATEAGRDDEASAGRK